jgi:hypothetical protein
MKSWSLRWNAAPCAEAADGRLSRTMPMSSIRRSSLSSAAVIEMAVSSSGGLPTGAR